MTAEGIVTAIAVEAALTLPLESVTVDVKLWLPLAREPVVSVHVPLALAVVVPICVVPSNTVTVLLAAAVPVSLTSVVPLTMEAAVSTGELGGGVPSTAHGAGMRAPGTSTPFTIVA